MVYVYSTKRNCTKLQLGSFFGGLFLVADIAPVASIDAISFVFLDGEGWGSV